MAEFSIREVCWHDAHPALSEIRRQVFIFEQGVPEALEWDGLDEAAIHLLAIANSAAIGCARILPVGRIGRMAVLQPWRGHGIGRALLETAIDSCRKHGWQHITLSAQTHALDFYAQSGFRVCSEEYQDAGIRHRDMQLMLSI